MALVLHGAAMQETELRAQAPNSYRLAIQANPDQTLAWQGLISFYEKNETDEGKEELIDAYQKLVTLERYIINSIFDLLSAPTVYSYNFVCLITVMQGERRK